jgi:VWFA-related protein
MVSVSLETAANNGKRWGGAKWLALGLGLAVLGGAGAGVRRLDGQTAGSQAQSGQTAPAQTQPSSDIPDAPSSVQPPSAKPEPPPPARPPEAKPAVPVARDPWTNQPIPQGSTEAGAQPASDNSEPAPPMPPVKTVPPGTAPKKPSSQDQLYTLVIRPSFVQVPVTVRDRDGRTVDGLLSSDFKVKENGVVQKLSFFTADPFALSVAVVLDLGMSDSAVQKVNQTFPALVGAFAPYDEVALYTYSSTVSQVSDFAAPTQKLGALLNQMKTERGHNNGPAVLDGPLAPNGPIVNGMPVGSPTQPVYTPPKESRVLNDAILRAALDLSKRDRTRRKIIFVISSGREYGSKAGYKDVLRLLLTNEVEVKAVGVESAALPVYGKIERLHLPLEGYGNILPKYASATGGGEYNELSRSAIEDIYAQIMSEARNQYTLGYTPTRPKTPTVAAYREIEVLVERPNLKVTAKSGYYPVASSAR